MFCFQFGENYFQELLELFKTMCNNGITAPQVFSYGKVYSDLLTPNANGVEGVISFSVYE